MKFFIPHLIKGKTASVKFRAGRAAISAGIICWNLDCMALNGNRGLGPDGISSLVISISRNVSKIQTGYVYHYAFAMLIGLGFLLIRFVVY